MQQDMNVSNPNLAKMEAVLEMVAAEIDLAVDILHYENGRPVTALDGWQIERIFDGLRSIMVQVDEALAYKRDTQSIPAKPVHARRKLKFIL